MLYITTESLNNNLRQEVFDIDVKDRLYKISEKDLNNLIYNNIFIDMIPSNDNRDNEFINRYGLPVIYQHNVEFQTGDKLIVASGKKLNMVIFS